ncbi:MAG: phosphoribosylaminoimidazolesuccinocarboxamide synthase [Candidatus Hydrogenedentota bacterium]
MALLYEGKAKRMHTTTDPEQLIMEFKDSATAFNGKKKAELKNKGKINKKLTLYFFEMLEDHGIPTHLIRDLSENEILVKRVSIIPVELIVRNIVAGSLSKRSGLPEGTALDFPVIEYYYKSDELGDPMINSDHILVLNLATEEELQIMRSMALKINEILSLFFDKAGILLVDFKLEFGKTSLNEIVLADEISPDTCRFWDKETGKKLDKDRFRRDLGDVIESYMEVLGRVENALCC